MLGFRNNADEKVPHVPLEGTAPQTHAGSQTMSGVTVEQAPLPT
jgi:hypothetical protein